MNGSNVGIDGLLGLGAIVDSLNFRVVLFFLGGGAIADFLFFISESGASIYRSMDRWVDRWIDRSMDPSIDQWVD